MVAATHSPIHSKESPPTLIEGEDVSKEILYNSRADMNLRGAYIKVGDETEMAR